MAAEQMGYWSHFWYRRVIALPGPKMGSCVLGIGSHWFNPRYILGQIQYNVSSISPEILPENRASDDALSGRECIARSHPLAHCRWRMRRSLLAIERRAGHKSRASNAKKAALSHELQWHLPRKWARKDGGPGENCGAFRAALRDAA